MFTGKPIEKSGRKASGLKQLATVAGLRFELSLVAQLKALVERPGLFLFLTYRFEGYEMKRMFLTCAIFVAFQAHACDVVFHAPSREIGALIKENGFGFKNYDLICKKLELGNARLRIDGFATVLSNRSIAWAAVSVLDKETSVSTSDGGVSTQAHENASMDVAKKLLMDSINSAVNNSDIDRALVALEANRKHARLAFSR